MADSLALLDRVWPAATLPVVCYRGVIDIALVRSKWTERLALEKDAFRVALAKLLEEADGEAPGRDREGEHVLVETANRFDCRVAESPDTPDGFTYDLLLDGKSANLPEGGRAVMESIIQDLDGIPPDYLVAAGPGLYRRRPVGAKDPDSVWAGTYHEEGAFIYDEWDHTRQHHRKGGCVLREHQMHAGGTEFYSATLGKYGGLIKSLRRTFEVLRGEDRILKRQPEGDGVDIDALVETWADARYGLEMSERVFTRLHKDERNIAVMLMVDMSGSTKGWINQAEREALILLAESLETLGDRHAIYGFSGWTRKRCEVFPVKAFEDRWDDAARGRVCAIEPKDYTRMGAPIRHLTHLLQAVEARTKVLISLSDGKPDDYDSLYRGEYGIEDTRQALFEARLQGVHPFCITIDEQGAEYLPHMYGAASYIILDDVAKLPLKVSDIYRRLTT